MAAHITSLPPEAMELIVSSLETSDVKNLRLTCRTCAAMASGGQFRNLFTHKRLDFERGALEAFVQLTSSAGLPCLLQDLTIVGVCRLSPDGNIDSQSIGDESSLEALLYSGFQNIRRHGKTGHIRKLSFKVEVRTHLGQTISPPEKMCKWRSVWAKAALVTQSTMLPLSDSSLPIQHLDLFYGDVCCSLAFDKIAPALQTFIASPAAKSLQCLSLSLSHSISSNELSATNASLRSDASGPRDVSSLAAARNRVTDVTRLLECSSTLESLQLHWYRLIKFHPTAAQLEEENFFNTIADSKVWSSVKSCTLSGIYTSQLSLMKVFQASRIESITMEEMHLDKGESFRSVFDYLTRIDTSLAYLYFDDLYQQGLLRFEAPGKPKLATYGAKPWPNSVTRTGPDVRRKITYHQPTGRVMGSPENARWRRENRLKYGPPDTSGPQPLIIRTGLELETHSTQHAT
jgi:hypothetical protein